MSFQAGRTTGAAELPTKPCNWLKTVGSSLGACSVSIRIQSNPEPPMTSATTLLQRLHQRPICDRPSRIACLNEFGESCVVMLAAGLCLGWLWRIMAVTSRFGFNHEEQTVEND